MTDNVGSSKEDKVRMTLTNTDCKSDPNSVRLLIIHQQRTIGGDTSYTERQRLIEQHLDQGQITNATFLRRTS